LKEFIHLHNHTHYSLLDAICTVDGLVKAAIENKMPAVALTDHGVMYGAMEFYKKCKQRGVKPIIGFETYVAQSGSRFDRGNKINTKAATAEIIDAETDERLSTANINYAHLILLAKNEVGYRNLLKINSIGHTEGYYYKPRVDLEVLEKYREGIVALSACAHGVISCHIVRDDIRTAHKMAGVYKDIYGEDFYLELQNHLSLDSEKKVLKEMPGIAKELGIKLIATNDVHYIKREHAVAHNIYLHLSAKQNKSAEPVDLTENLRYGTDQIYFKTTKEMCELFSDYPEAIESTLEVAEKCNLELDLSVKHMPAYRIPEGVESKTLDEYLEKISWIGLKKRFKEVTPEAEERLKYELGIIKKMNFPGYFLIVQDFINTAKSRGILVGPGRGSAAGSLVCYCIGITNVDPLKYNLLFERFLNPERISMPDIDIDFQDDRRDEVIQYAKETYGEKSVAQIITFNRLAPRGVLKDVGRVLNFPFQEINELTKLIPILFGKVKSLKDCMTEVPDFRKYFDDKTAKQNRKVLLDNACTLENLNKNSSIHASGVVIAPADVIDYVPLSKVTGEDSVYCTQYDMNQLEDAGLIKIDFLGLKELKVISKTLNLVNKKYNKELTIDNIPLDDEKTFRLFSAGATTGIFQFSKDKMKEYLSKMKPKNINDLAIMNALNRPGPMKLIPDLIDKRFGRKPTTYMHPKMEPALKETYGIIIYQEQVMQIAREVAGFTMAQADNMRKAMGKKIKEKMKQVKEDFIKGSVKNGLQKKLAEDIFALILDFADYGFNKSHAVAYSFVSFYTAYLKANFPVEFLAVSMECRKDDETELQFLAEECQRMKIRVKQPDINLSELDFKVYYNGDEDETGEIIYGLSAIKNVGEKAAENIIKERELNGGYKSLVDFLIRVDLRLVNKKTLEGLIQAGAFDCVEKNRKKLFYNLETATIYAQRYKERPESWGQEGLSFESAKPATAGHGDLRLREYDEFPLIEKLNLERAAIGFYVTGHPLDEYRKDIKSHVNLSFGSDLSEDEIDRMGTAKMCGVISDLQIRQSKRGNKFVVFNLLDLYGTGECIAFSNLYESKMNLFKNDSLVFVEGKAEKNGEKIKLVVDTIFPIERIHEHLGQNLIINVQEGKISYEVLNRVRELIEASPGNCYLFFNITGNGTKKIFKSKEFKINPTSELISNLKKLVGEHNLNIN
jgi:DNA polymerase III subunit alpha